MPLFRRMRYEIKNTRTGQVVAADAFLAASPWARMRGLLGRASLPTGEAIILRPASSIHTAFMRFAIDVVFLDKDDRVLKVVRDLAPFRLSAARHARSVIEMAGGALKDVDLQAGDALEMRFLG
jgi:uncharacterized membrane protein (UPF0127 family)